ncbi:hypothetical protein KR767_11890 [Luteibacter anthropi]|uniref:DUF6531 domain-containing protein n=1 Tax=Luteibacter anthropi TaxID=564369 RepID=UPI0020329772|nr:DUF6531 domain-containing protein [Luteibacter anthropi]URX60803.1 hypothetical protein KR767_11890 [Luteibacter anthropi]
MKTTAIAVSIILSLANVAHADEVWFALDSPSFPPADDMAHYPSADAACQAAYKADVAKYNSGNSHVLAYVAPTFAPMSGNPYLYNCDTLARVGEGAPQHIPHIIAVVEGPCDVDKVFDFVTGECVLDGDALARKQFGDPDDDPNNDPNDCQGNPINAAIGNKFQRESDFADADGELAFTRFYNSADGRWRHTYSANLIVGMGVASLTLDDGRASLFAVTGSVATGESSERGSLSRSGSKWIYSSPANDVYTFNGQGQLTSYRGANGLTQTLTYGFDANFNIKVTVKDSRGHTLVFTKGFSEQLVSLSSTGVSVTYTYSDEGQLQQATRKVQGKTTSRRYVYEDVEHPRFLTGLFDERGVRAATWTYDSQGRAISSEHAGGADKTVIAYVDDATTTVTNPLGHVVTYTYGTVGGTRRMTSVSGEPVPGCPISNSSFTYDARGQIATQTNALGRITAFTYDPQGRITTKTEAKSTPEERTITTTWDGTSFRPATVTTADRVTSYTYDANGRPLSTTVRSLKD